MLEHSRRFLLLAGAFLLLSLAGACLSSHKDLQEDPAATRPVLQMLALTWKKSAEFDRKFLLEFGRKNNIGTQLVPNLDPVNVRLEMYKRIFAAHSSQPDMVDVDIVWPAIFADDLVDLRPYLKDPAKSFSDKLLASYTVRGRLVALPVLVDTGLLYYRPELMAKYGFHAAPRTWDELEQMAARIQAGERRAGNKDFWGFTWQGYASEALTCNGVEWQASAGAGVFLEPDGVNVRDERFIRMLRRVSGWINTISPPGEFVYNEPDSENLWVAGQTAFMRDWASSYGELFERAGKDPNRLSVAPVPGGAGGQRSALGGMGVSVSNYAANRGFALKAVLEMTSEQQDYNRLTTTLGLPIRTDVRERQDVKALSPLQAIAPAVFEGLVARPSVLAGDQYNAVSLEYAKAINLVLRGKVQPEQAMADLERKLMLITGLKAKPY